MINLNAKINVNTNTSLEKLNSIASLLENFDLDISRDSLQLLLDIAINSNCVDLMKAVCRKSRVVAEYELLVGSPYHTPFILDLLSDFVSFNIPIEEIAQRISFRFDEDKRFGDVVIKLMSICDKTVPSSSTIDAIIDHKGIDINYGAPEDSSLHKYLVDKDLADRYKSPNGFVAVKGGFRAVDD